MTAAATTTTTTTTLLKHSLLADCIRSYRKFLFQPSDVTLIQCDDMGKVGTAWPQTVGSSQMQAGSNRFAVYNFLPLASMDDKLKEMKPVILAVRKEGFEGTNCLCSRPTVFNFLLFSYPR
jgi:hypothetical protein